MRGNTKQTERTSIQAAKDIGPAQIFSFFLTASVSNLALSVSGQSLACSSERFEHKRRSPRKTPCRCSAREDPNPYLF
jgi:hypothetical protein